MKSEDQKRREVYETSAVHQLCRAVDRLIAGEELDDTVAALVVALIATLAVTPDPIQAVDEISGLMQAEIRKLRGTLN